MSLFDPGTVNRQIDAYLASVPANKRVVLLGNANLVTKQLGGAIMLKVDDTVGFYVRVSKAPGQPLESDAGIKIAFLAGLPPPDEGDTDDYFTYSELVAVLKDRGFNWLRAHMGAYRLLRGGEIAL